MHYFHALCLFLYLKQKYEALLCDRGTIDRVAIHSIQCVGSGSWFVWFILSVFEHEQKKILNLRFQSCTLLLLRHLCI
jgi:hypothetical protein